MDERQGNPPLTTNRKALTCEFIWNLILIILSDYREMKIQTTPDHL